MTRSILPGSRSIASSRALTSSPGSKPTRNSFVEPLAEPPGGIVLAIGMQTGVEQRPALGMLDQIDRDRHGDVALAALHQVSELAGDRAAGEGEKLRNSLVNHPSLHRFPAQAGIHPSAP